LLRVKRPREEDRVGHLVQHALIGQIFDAERDAPMLRIATEAAAHGIDRVGRHARRRVEIGVGKLIANVLDVERQRERPAAEHVIAERRRKRDGLVRRERDTLAAQVLERADPVPDRRGCTGIAVVARM